MDVFEIIKNIPQGSQLIVDSIIEFKVYDGDEEKSLQDTVQSALKQIEEKAYAQVLVEKGIPEDHIRKYGFAF